MVLLIASQQAAFHALIAVLIFGLVIGVLGHIISSRTLILTGILMNLDIYFQPTSLWNTIFMFGLIGGGVGLFAKGLRPHKPKG